MNDTRYWIDDLELDDFPALCSWFGLDADERTEEGALKYIGAADVAAEVIRRNDGILTNHRITVYSMENAECTYYNC